MSFIVFLCHFLFKMLKNCKNCQSTKNLPSYRILLPPPPACAFWKNIYSWLLLVLIKSFQVVWFFIFGMKLILFGHFRVKIPCFYQLPATCHVTRLVSFAHDIGMIFQLKYPILVCKSSSFVCKWYDFQLF